MLTLSVFDLKPREALQAARRLRCKYRHLSPNELVEDEETLSKALSYVGGRLSFISKMAKGDDIVEMAKYMVQREKGWLLSQIGLIPDHDDDVMDEVS